MTTAFEPTPLDAGTTGAMPEASSAPDDTPTSVEGPAGELPAPMTPETVETGVEAGSAASTDATDTPGPEDAIAAAGAPAPGAGTDGPEPVSRRRKALLVLLAGTCAVFLVFSGWYLLNRKPITVLPLPIIAAEQVPHYAFSVYGVTAPTGVAVSADGSRIYVTQTEQDAKVLILDRDGRVLAAAAPPASTGTEHTPVYVALSPTSGDLYVSDRPAGSIYVFSADGLYRRTFDPGLALVGWQPLGLSFDQQGDLFVTDVSGPYHRIHEFGPDGALLRTIGSAGLFNFPNGVAADSAGNTYVSDSNNGRLVVFDPSGDQVAVIRRGAAEGDLGLPRGIAIDGDGRVYVVDTMAQGVQIYHAYQAGERAPAFVGRFGAEGTADGSFEYPNGVTTDARGRIYVTDWRNNRVQVWSW